jgi:hypothetical protein
MGDSHTSGRPRYLLLRMNQSDDKTNDSWSNLGSERNTMITHLQLFVGKLSMSCTLFQNAKLSNSRLNVILILQSTESLSQSLIFFLHFHLPSLSRKLCFMIGCQDFSEYQTQRNFVKTIVTVSRRNDC